MVSSRSTRPSSDKLDLVREVAAIRTFLEKNSRLGHHKTRFRLELALSFLKGLTFALGSLAAVVVITPIFVWFLHNVAWPPLIDNVVSAVIRQIEQVNRQSQPKAVGQ